MDKFYLPNNETLFPIKLSNIEENKLSIALSIFPIYKISTFYKISLDKDILNFHGKIEDITNDKSLLKKILDAGNLLGVYVGKNEDNVTKSWLDCQRINLKTLLKENQFQLQKIFFERKKNVIITGGTGVGKTSQVPKILWYYNCLFDGFSCFENKIDIEDKSQLLNLFVNMKEEVVVFKDLTLMFPRKQLIISSYENMYKSLGNIDIFNLLYRDSEIKYNSIFRLNFIVPKLGAFIAKDTSIVIFDEIHEHDSAMDSMISVYSKSYLNKNLRNIILMSATIEDDVKDFDVFFKKNWFHFHIKGERRFPVKEEIIKGDYLNLINYRLPNKGEVGILFFSSVSKVNEAMEVLEEKFGNTVVLFDIYSKNEKNSEFIRKAETIKDKPVILVSTPLLESSITINNATIIYDTGEFYLSKMYFSGSTYKITHSMYEQRKGRVGRTRPGLYLCNNKNFSNIRKIDVSPLAPFIFEFSKYKLNYTNLFQRPHDLTRWFKTKEWFIQKTGKNIRSLYSSYSKLGDTNFDPLLILKLKDYIDPNINKYFKGKKLNQDELFKLAQILNFTGTFKEKQTMKDGNIRVKYILDNPIEQNEKSITLNLNKNEKNLNKIYILDIGIYFFNNL